MFLTMSAEWAVALSCRVMAFYRLPFLNGVASTWCLHTKCKCIAVHMLHLMVTFTSTCQMLWNVYTPLPALPHFCSPPSPTCTQEVAMTYGVTLICLSV
jgi:hypothetical protein